MNSQQINLNGGAITPLLSHRTDLEKHTTGLAACHNFIPLPYGGVRKRPGTQFLTTLSDVTGPEKLHAFQGSDGARYILIFCAEKFQAWDITNQTLHTQDLDWPITAANLHELRLTALNDVLYITSPYFTPLQLSYFNATTWTIAPIAWTSAPLLTENLEEFQKLTVLSNPVATTWATATSYTVGQVRLSTDGTREYECITAHTSNTDRNPGVGADWRTYWKPKVYTAGTAIIIKTRLGITAWTTATAYKKGAYVTSSGKTWVALRDHTSGGDDVPGNEVYRGTYWKQLADIFDTLHTADDATFTPAASFQIDQRRDEQEYQTEIRATSGNDGKTSPPIIVDGFWDLTTFGTWQGTFTIQRSTDNGVTWTTARIYESEGDRNVSTEGEELAPTLMRILFTKNGSTGSGGTQRAVLAPRTAYAGARVTITAYTSATQVSAVTNEMLISGTTDKWAESAFSRKSGYPRATCLHERRLWFAGTTSRPASLWSSVIEDFLNFQTTTNDDGALHVTLATHVANAIQWLASARRLFIGCTYSEWVVGSEFNDAPITPTNFLAREYTRYGSANRAALVVGSTVLFAQRHNNRLREMAYIAADENYDAADLTRLAEHLFTYPDEDNNFAMTGMSWQESREPTLWVTRADGTLLTFTYVRAERVNAWASHSTGGGLFKQVCVSPTPTSADDDEIYFLTYRNNGGYCLERIKSNSAALAESADAPPVYDCQITTATITRTNPIPAHDVLADSYVDATSLKGNYHTTALFTKEVGYVIASLAEEAAFIIGAPIEAYICTLPLEAPTQTGSSIGRKKRAQKIRAHVHRARILNAVTEIKHNVAPGSTLAHWTKAEMKPAQDFFRYNIASDNYAKNTSLNYTGWVEQNITLSGLNLCGILHHNSPTPCTITALVVEYDIHQA